MFWMFLIVAIVAGMFLLPSHYLKDAGLDLPDQSGRKHTWQAMLFAALVLAMIALRLVPFAILLLLVGTGVIGMSVWRDRQLGGELDETSSGGDFVGQLPMSGKMTTDEALQILGLEKGASEQEIDAAHKRLITQIHPDKGGTDYLAAKINDARAHLKNQLSDRPSS